MGLFELEAIRRLPFGGGPAVREDGPGRQRLKRASSTSGADDWRTLTCDELCTAEWLRDGDARVAPTLAGQAVSRLRARQSQGRRG